MIKIIHFLFIMFYQLMCFINCANELYNDDHFEEVLNNKNYTVSYAPEEWNKNGFIITHPDSRIYLFKKPILNVDDLIQTILSHENIFGNKKIKISLMEEKERFQKIITSSSEKLLQSQLFKNHLIPKYFTSLNSTESPSTKANITTTESTQHFKFSFHFLMMGVTLFVVLFILLIIYILRKLYKRRRERHNLKNILNHESEFIL